MRDLILHEPTRKKFCELLEVASDEAFRELAKAAHEKRHSDFWAIIDNMAKLFDMEQKAECKTEVG